jgi:hypothetical protein
MAFRMAVCEHSFVTLLVLVGFVALAVVLYATSGKPARWLERRYWRRRREHRSS